MTVALVNFRSSAIVTFARYKTLREIQMGSEKDFKRDFCTELYPAYIIEKCLGLTTFTIKGCPGQRFLTKINPLCISRIML